MPSAQSSSTRHEVLFVILEFCAGMVGGVTLIYLGYVLGVVFFYRV
jgi:hypothetical protein